MLSSPDTLQMLLTRFTSMAWNTALKSSVLELPDLPDHQCSYNLSEIS